MDSTKIYIWIILVLALLGIIFLIAVVYFARRKVLCDITDRPWCWTDWTCKDQPEGSDKRCPVLPTQKLAQSCETDTGIPGCSNAFSNNNLVVEETDIPLFPAQNGPDS
jgi:hypothetical protein